MILEWWKTASKLSIFSQTCWRAFLGFISHFNWCWAASPCWKCWELSYLRSSIDHWTWLWRHTRGMDRLSLRDLSNSTLCDKHLWTGREDSLQRWWIRSIKKVERFYCRQGMRRTFPILQTSVIILLQKKPNIAGLYSSALKIC